MLAYLRRYPGPVSLSVGLLLLNIVIEMSLPQVIGAAVNQLERHRTGGATFEPWSYLRLFLALVVVRAAAGMVVGPIRNRLVQRVINDLRGGPLRRLAAAGVSVPRPVEHRRTDLAVNDRHVAADGLHVRLPVHVGGHRGRLGGDARR
ncbi:MAG: hypothetical protein V9G08_03680 [Dermatophilaceae bacterium]